MVQFTAKVSIKGHPETGEANVNIYYQLARQSKAYDDKYAESPEVWDYLTFYLNYINDESDTAFVTDFADGWSNYSFENDSGFEALDNDGYLRKLFSSRKLIV